MRLDIFAPEQLDLVHNASLDLLAQVGFQLEHPAACAKLEKAGCHVEGARVRIPRQEVEAALAQVPGPFTLYGRRSDWKAEIGWDNLTAMTLGGAPRFYDSMSGASRPANSQDLAKAARLADWAEHVDLFAALFGMEDVPGALTESTEYLIAAHHYTKAFNASIYTAAGVDYVTAMAAEVAGGLQALQSRPSVIYSICPISPLRYTFDLVEALIAVASYQMPVSLVPLPVLGISAPITAAGALAQQNAEVLAGIYLLYQYQAGLPVLYNGLINSADMRLGTSQWGPPEVGLLGAATAQLARRYNLPCKVYGFGASAANLDMQNGLERSANALLAALARPSMLGGVGSAGNLNLASLEGVVIDNDILSRIKHIQKGVALSPENFALQEIEMVMQGGSFLESRHTARNLHAGSLWRSQVEERTRRDERFAMGSDYVARAAAIVEAVLAEHPIPALPDRVEAELERLQAKAKATLAQTRA